MRTFIGGIFLIVFSAQAGATTLPAYWHNREAIKKLANKEPFSAYKELLKALEKDPLNPVLQMNLGLAFALNKEYPKAEQAYKGALELLPEKSPARFEAYFNLAAIQGLQGHVPEALQNYQAALTIKPDSLPAKTNIELLLRQQQGKSGQGQPKDNQGKSGQNQNQNKKNDQNQNKNKNSQGQQAQQPPQQPKPKPFQSRDLSKEDVKKILDEIKNQEEGIRAKAYERGVKQPAPNGEDW